MTPPSPLPERAPPARRWYHLSGWGFLFWGIIIFVVGLLIGLFPIAIILW
jgi:hypothetical protein